MAIPPPQQPPESFSLPLAASLFPSLLSLVSLSSLSTAPPTSAAPQDVTIPHVGSNGTAQTRDQAKVELGRTATELRNTLALLKAQASSFKAGERSIEDQERLCVELERLVEGKRSELGRLAELVKMGGGEVVKEEDVEMD